MRISLKGPNQRSGSRKSTLSEGPVNVACLGLLKMEKIDPPFYKNANF